MKQQVQLRYPHLDHSKFLRDVRYIREPAIALENCYFLGFRIAIENSYRYSHATIVADDYDAIIEGIVEEFNDIMDQQAVSSPRDIALVFVRSLVMQDPAKLRAIGYHYIQPDIQKSLFKRDDELFSVFGKIADDVFLSPVTTSDALTALKVVRYKCATQILKDFIPLEICQAHPVTLEFEILFNRVAKRIRLLINAEQQEKEYLH